MKPARRTNDVDSKASLHLVPSASSNAVIPSAVEGSQHFVSATTTARHSPLALWHLLSLDAPTVAALWTYFIARTTGIALKWQSPAAMFVAVWMLYAADRLLDARTNQDLEERHRFHHRHRTGFLAGIAIAAPILALLLHQLPAATLHLYTLLATLLGAWLLIIHARALGSHRLPKELAVGLFFPAAAFIPTVAAAPQLRLALLAPALCFAAVCTLNCLFVYAWEHPHQRLNAHATTRWGTKYLVPLTIVAMVIALASSTIRVPQVSLLRPGFPTPHSSIGIACTLSVALLITLHNRRHRIAPTTLRALADAALLTPLLFLAR